MNILRSLWRIVYNVATLGLEGKKLGDCIFARAFLAGESFIARAERKESDMRNRKPIECPVVLYDVLFFDENWCELEMLHQRAVSHWDMVSLLKAFHHDRVNDALSSTLLKSIYKDVKSITIEMNSHG